MFEEHLNQSSPVQLDLKTSKNRALAQRLRERYGGPKPAEKIRDRRLRGLATVIENAPDDWRAIQGGIKKTGLSCAYLSVRFKEEAKLPMRSYALWLKFEHACLLTLAGQSARDAAINAGFADQSHLGRAARRFAHKSFGRVQSEFSELAAQLDAEPEPVPASYVSTFGGLRVAS